MDSRGRALRFFFRAIHGSIKKRGGPIGDRGPRGVFFSEPSMAKPNVQIRRIWTFATGLLNLLRRPSFFFPSHKWIGEKNVRKTRESEERPSPQIPLESERTRNRRNGRPLRFQKNLRGPGIGGTAVPSDSRVFLRPILWVGKKNPPGAPISDRAPAFFYRPMKWVGKKILRHAPANPFMRFARRAVNLRGPGIGGTAVPSDSRVFLRPISWVGKKNPPGAPISDRAPGGFFLPTHEMGR